MKNRVEIIPAILPKDFSEVVEKVLAIKGAAKTVQVDICDGHFVPSFTWPYKKHDDSFEKIIHEDEGLPQWHHINYEFDLMVDNPEKIVDDWVMAGATRIILHIESKGDMKAALELLKGRVEIGLALNIETDIDSLKAYADDIQFIQLMGIDRIGFQGQEFDERVISRIKEVKAAYPNLPISIDGGVSFETASKLIEAGAGRLVVGSAVFNSENPLEAIRDLGRL